MLERYLCRPLRAGHFMLECLTYNKYIAVRAAHTPAGRGDGAGVATVAPLEDRFGRRHNYLRISLTERCNLRCRYCMPAGGVPLSARAQLLTSAELVRLVRVFAALGVDKVRLTGGEPTLRADLPALIEGVRASGVRRVSLTTNGVTLTRRLPALQRAGLALDGLNVSLDSLRPDRFEHISRRPAKALARVLAGIDLALQLGYRPVKINVVLMKDVNDDEICDFVQMTRDRPIDVRFIEFMPFAGNAWSAHSLLPYRAALRRLAASYELRPLPRDPHHTAKMWTVEGHEGRVGFITSMTEHFCSTCNRLRLTADGSLKVCLLGAGEVSLRDALRAGADDAALCDTVRAALRHKHARHAARASGVRRRLGARAYCTLTHVDGEGRARMVDVGHKPMTARVAEAQCALRVSGTVLRLLRAAALPKGDALAVAQVAGALAAKRTASLVPLCHPLPLDCVRVSVQLPDGEVDGVGDVTVRCRVAVTARTGAEMEALTGAAVAALTLYDMCKSADKHMSITDLHVTHKSGGSSDVTASPPSTPPSPPDADSSPSSPPAESYAPTNFTF